MLIDPSTLFSPPLFSAAEIRAIEARCTDLNLMESAGASAANLAASLARDTGDAILVLVGPGNNGGDALVAARELMAQGFRVNGVGRAETTCLPADAARALTRFSECGGILLRGFPDRRAYSLVIDGLFGIGLERAVEGEYARWIEAANRLACPKLALDIPSGLDSDTGQVRKVAFRADHTLTFIGLKPGLFTADGPDHCGQIHLDPLGLDPAAVVEPKGYALMQPEARHHLPARSKNSHKGLFGHVGIIGAAPGMVGAGLIAGRAALKMGAGMATVGALDERIVVDYLEPRLMFGQPERLVESALDVLAIGPGLGRSARAHDLLNRALAFPKPLVLDADALNLLASQPQLARLAAARPHPTLLTPHPGEAARLLGISNADIQSDRIQAASRISLNFHAHVVLKGAGSVIVHPDGRYVINTSGGPWLAQAGSGDQLTGMLAALLAQHMIPADALEAAVWRHGSAVA